MSEEKTSLSKFIAELRNRRVFRVAAVYLGVGFAVLEASDIIIPMLGLPEIMPFVILCLLMIGFPIATTLSWHFQMTEEGLRRSPKSGEKHTPDHKPFTSNVIITSLLIIIIGLLAYPRFVGEVSHSETASVETSVKVDPKSIAVLPFTSFADEREDEIFADGMHDDILTQLSKIRALKVISRTTMMKYKDTQKSIKEIAQEVGVANLLEGSVRRAGDQVRIVAQLINAKTDEHLWAETYDRAYADIFAIQSDVAKKIAGALKSALSPEEQANIDAIPTTNMAAYDYFLKGNHFWYTKTTKEGNLKAVAMYEEAIKLDSNFGLAYARQSIAHSVLFQSQDWDPTPERKILARKTLEQAQRLIPDHPEVHFAQGIFYQWCLDDPGSAIQEYEIAAEGQPGNGEVANHLGQLYFRAGNWTKAEQYLERAYELEPDGISIAGWLAGYHSHMGNYEVAEETYRKAIQSFPENTIAYRFYANFVKDAFGDLKRARQILNEGVLTSDNPELLASSRAQLEIDAGNYESALQIIQEDYSGDFPALHKSIIYNFLDNKNELSTELEHSRKNLENMLRGDQDQAFIVSRLGLIQAMAGDKAGAIAAGKRAIELEPVAKDALNGPGHHVGLAIIYSLVGEIDLAFDELEYLLSFKTGFTKWQIILSPFFDALRDHPRYQKLIMSTS